MMIMHEKITGTDLEERSRELAKALGEAEASLNAAALQNAYGEIGDDQLRPFREKVETIRVQQAGILAAIEGSRRDAAAAERETAREERRKAAATLRRLTAEEAVAVKAIDRLIAKAAPHLSALQQIANKKRSCAVDSLSRDQRSSMAGSIMNTNERQRQFFEHALHRAGFEPWRMGVSFAGPWGDLEALIAAEAKEYSRRADEITDEAAGTT